MNQIASLPLPTAKLLELIHSILATLGTGSKDSGFAVPLGASGITLLVNMANAPDALTITLRFSGIPIAAAELYVSHLMGGNAHVSPVQM